MMASSAFFPFSGDAAACVARPRYVTWYRVMAAQPGSAMVLLCGLALSLGIELIQVDLPGRCSSLYDLLANGLGMLGGVAYGLMEKRFSPPGD